MNALSNPQLSDIYTALIELSAGMGEIKGHSQAMVDHLALINGTIKEHAEDIQALKTADEVNKAGTVRFRWFLGVMIPVTAAIAVAVFESGLL